MKQILMPLAVIVFCLGCNNDQKEKPAPAPAETSKTALSPTDLQIKLALLAAPAEKRDSCTVMGYNADKELVVLREGTNELICLADNPDDKDLSVACYCKDMEPFMQRGRDLRKEGIKDPKEIFNTRKTEVEAGTLPFPKGPSTLYVYTAKDENVNRTTGEVKDGYLRYVIYIPYATAASTGLPEKPSADGMPWIMFPGTYGAHIMINPKE